MLRLRTAVPVVLLVHALLSLDRAADGAPKPVDDGVVSAATLRAVFDRVGEAAGGKWQRKGWNDPFIEEWLARLVAEVGAATGEQLVVPARFADLRPQRFPDDPADDEPADRPRVPNVAQRGANRGTVSSELPVIEGALMVGREANMRVRLRRCIVLVDGHVSVTAAEHCVIIARGAVSVSSGEENVIVAGQLVHIRGGDGRRAISSRDNPEVIRGPDGRPQKRIVARGGILVSGSTLHAYRAAGSILVARDRMAVLEAHECVVINPPAVIDLPMRENCREVASDSLRIGGTPSVLAGEVQVDRLVTGKTVDFRFRGERYVVEKGKAVTGENGRPVAGLEGWTATFVSSGAAVFTNGRDDFVAASAEPL